MIRSSLLVFSVTTLAIVSGGCKSEPPATEAEAKKSVDDPAAMVQPAEISPDAADTPPANP
jgi:hypothetical protein